MEIFSDKCKRVEKFYNKGVNDNIIKKDLILNYRNSPYTFKKNFLLILIIAKLYK